MKNNGPHPLLLIILDGWGYREETAANAIAAANKPHWDAFWKAYPHTLISGSGKCVGLPDNQMGNSEVGHLNMGAGRIVRQDFTRIDAAIEDKRFFSNRTFIHALNQAKKNHQAVHVLGLLSKGGVHSHERHFHAFIQLAAALHISQLYLHPFLDGRDTPPKSAMASLDALTAQCRQSQCGQIVSLIGRYYAMDRDKRWERVQQAYDRIVTGRSEFQAETAEQALALAYARGETDEFVKATRIQADHAPPVTLKKGDLVIYLNFRSDRARELTQSLIDPAFDGFHREVWPQLGGFVCLSEYDERFKASVAFPPQPMDNLLADYLSQQGLKQLRIAETEKYAHVTFFFNGGVEAPYPNEDRVLIPSPAVATYDLQPSMSAPALTSRLIEEINRCYYDVIICNFANADMVGHTGNFEATVQAIETLDDCLGRILNALFKVGGEALITADHGNAEQMWDTASNQPHTAHTSDPVPLLYLGRSAEFVKTDGKLSDISPTMLYLLALPAPTDMTGKNLLK